ncbi:MAG: hypothetical protein WCX70_01455 [Candidatus Paceibacterota bacterium]|jgi:hypothetical protein
MLTVILGYYASCVSDKVKLGDGAVDYKWVMFEEAKDYDIIEGIWKEIKMVDKILKAEREVELQKV